MARLTVVDAPVGKSRILGISLATLTGMSGQKGLACVLCRTDIALWELDTVSNMVAHTWCAETYLAEAAAVLAEAEALVLATTDKRMHRRSAR